MLGELVYEGTGKPMGMRVLDDNGTLELYVSRTRRSFRDTVHERADLCQHRSTRWNKLLGRSRSTVDSGR
jgi:hypothetical protein